MSWDSLSPPPTQASRSRCRTRHEGCSMPAAGDCARPAARSPQPFPGTTSLAVYGVRGRATASGTSSDGAVPQGSQVYAGPVGHPLPAVRLTPRPGTPDPPVLEGSQGPAAERPGISKSAFRGPVGSRTHNELSFSRSAAPTISDVSTKAMMSPPVVHGDGSDCRDDAAVDPKLAPVVHLARPEGWRTVAAVTSVALRCPPQPQRTPARGTGRVPRERGHTSRGGRPPRHRGDRYPLRHFDTRDALVAEV